MNKNMDQVLRTCSGKCISRGLADAILVAQNTLAVFSSAAGFSMVMVGAA